jgi:hypothetical protein
VTLLCVLLATAAVGLLVLFLGYSRRLHDLLGRDSRTPIASVALPSPALNIGGKDVDRALNELRLCERRQPLLELQSIQLSVEAAFGDQLVVGAPLHDAAAVHDEDLVRIHDGR